MGVLGDTYISVITQDTDHLKIHYNVLIALSVPQRILRSTLQIVVTEGEVFHHDRRYYNYTRTKIKYALHLIINYALDLFDRKQ
jgi:hypothetical protein